MLRAMDDDIAVKRLIERKAQRRRGHANCFSSGDRETEKPSLWSNATMPVAVPRVVQQE